ncbi:MAG TPA: class I SAM-dependent methyltransferase [Gaiellaceae bacterium]|nr:class I SAM-dependent methyltransferase [Gaiellaceae bacterium]
MSPSDLLGVADGLRNHQPPRQVGRTTLLGLTPSPGSGPAGPPSFDRCAARYDELRPVDGNWWQLFDAIVVAGSLRGRRVLEVGCGTGRLAAALAERARARVWAVDASAEMVARAKALGVNARVARAEALPFKRGWFDAVVMRMVVHLLDRPRAFADAARVLAPGGVLVVASEDPDAFDEIWFARFFPSVPALDRARFPAAPALEAELAAAGLPATRVERLVQERTIGREQALDVIASKAYSTFELLPAGEYAAGLARAEAELPDALAYRFHWLVVSARR